MKVLIVFNQPAPYKVRLFSLLAKSVDLTVIFEKKSCPNRHSLFYASNIYDFNHIFLKKGSFGEENSSSNEIIKHLKENKYDLIIMNGYHTITEQKTIRYMNRHKIKWVLFINGGLIKKESILKKIYKTSLIKTASYYLSPCEKANEYLTYYGAKKENIYLYPNSTIYEKDVLQSLPSEQDKMDVINKYHLPFKNFYICPTQFIKRKNNMTLLKVFKDRKETLLLVGNGVEEDKYKQYIEENNMNTVHILPYLSSNDLYEYFKVAKGLITLSFEDIYGHTVNEAFAKGLIVISSNNVVAATKLIKNNINGFIVPPTDIKAINDALDKVDTLQREECLKVARENTFEKQAQVMVEIMKGLTK